MTEKKYPPCARRQSLILFNQDGQARKERCLEQSAEKANQDVVPEDCAACPVRVELLQVDKKSGRYKPPTTIPALVQFIDRPDPGGDGFPDCPHRMIANVPGCCGRVTTVRVCNSVDAARYGADTTPAICRECLGQTPETPPNERKEA